MLPMVSPHFLPGRVFISLTTDMVQDNRIGLLGNPEVLKDHEDSNCTNNITTSKKGEDP